MRLCRYVDVTKSRNKHDNTTALHHYKVDVFNVAIDQQLVELEDRFSSQVLTDKTHIHLRSASVRTYTFFTTGIP
jgi:hypothetical protein